MYRIKAVNKDGSFVYSNLVADNYRLSPNPATITLNISGLSSIINYQFSIVNKEGKQQSSYKISSSTNNKINISSLHNGIYFIKIKDGNGVVSSLKFVKE